MKKNILISTFILVIIILVGCTGNPASQPQQAASSTETVSLPTATNTPTVVPTPIPTNTPVPLPDPFDLISQDQMFSYLTDLSSIQAYSGWRSAATTGEAEAFDYVSKTLQTFPFLEELGMEWDRQTFPVFSSTEFWETTLEVSVNGQAKKIAANGIGGPSGNLEYALLYDSDGKINDTENNPVTISGSAFLIQSADQIKSLKNRELAGKIVFLDYGVIFCNDNDCEYEKFMLAMDLFDKKPAGIVVVTQFSEQAADDHGAFAGDGNVLSYIDHTAKVPVFSARLEDMADAGVAAWDDLSAAESVTMTLDADVISPDTSENLVVKIPGVDTSRSIMLGAHIDSANSPGALDDGSGSVVLLETARLLNDAKVQPPVNLYLAWFGSEELGLMGSRYYANTHQEILDNLLGMAQIDSLMRPISDIHPRLNLVNRTYEYYGIEGQSFADVVASAASKRGVETVPVNYPSIGSDSWAFAGYDVPNTDVIYKIEDNEEQKELGGWHFSGYAHSPYDTVEMAKEVGDVLEDMVTVALSAALDVPQDNTSFKVTPPKKYHALFIGNHSDNLATSPAELAEFSMALAAQGFDIQYLGRGITLTEQALTDIELAIVLPVYDFPEKANGLTQYDEALTKEDVEILKKFVTDGGLLVLTNSSSGDNEDNTDINLLAKVFGINYQDKQSDQIVGEVLGEHDLTKDMQYVIWRQWGGVLFNINKGQVLAQTAEGRPAIALIDFGEQGGQVIALTDVSILNDIGGELTNLQFWKNLAAYASGR